MGRGIAYVSIANGIATRLVDVSDSQLRRAQERIAADLSEGVSRNKLTLDVADRARGLLTVTTDLTQGCDGAALIVEAVVESLPLKQDILRQMEALAPSSAVMATNTSAMSITELGSIMLDPSRLVGMHFFNPVPRMRLCELVVGLQTAEKTIAVAESAARAMGKTTVRVQDMPGFATSRVNALLGNEGLRMLEEGVASPEDIDTAVKLALNHPMGPLEMADLVGLDVRLAVLETLAATLGDRFRPTGVHRRLVAAGRLGRKTGHGIYKYDDDGARVDEPSDLGR
jgi:3-hydroxybutyryl-CoA dehydrogenase